MEKLNQLNIDQKKVLLGIAIFYQPVELDALDYLLAEDVPNFEKILNQLSIQQVIRFVDNHYELVDLTSADVIDDYNASIISQLPRRFGLFRTRPDFSPENLKIRAIEYFKSQQLEPDKLTSLADAEPYFAEYRVRFGWGEFEQAYINFYAVVDNFLLDNKHYEVTLDFYQPLEDKITTKKWKSGLYRSLGNIYFGLEDYDMSKNYYIQSSSLLGKFLYSDTHNRVYIRLADIAKIQEDWEHYVDYLQQSIKLSMLSEDRFGEVIGRHQLADFHREELHFREAVSHYEKIIFRCEVRLRGEKEWIQLIPKSILPKYAR